MKTSPTIIPHAPTLLAAVLLLIPTTHAAPEAAAAEPEFHIPKVSPQPESLAKLAAAKQQAVFSLELDMPNEGNIMNKGFFLSRDGSAICPLLYLCREVLPRFDASDGTTLDRPKVIATFPDHNLALLKFKYQPQAWLEIAAKRPEVGQWVAVVSTLRDPPAPVGPVLSYRAVPDMEYYYECRTHMSFAAGQSPSLGRVFASGAPLIDREGNVVGVQAGGTTRESQSLRSALPLDALGPRIKAALTSPGELPLPIDAMHHSFDAALLSPEWIRIDLARNAGESKLALKRIRELMERHPDCQALKTREWETMRMQGADAMTADEFLAATQRSAPPETATHVEKSEYQFRLATALSGIRGRAEETEAALLRAVALAPEVAHRAAANLGAIYMQRGQTKEAEALYRRAAALAPECVNYIERLQNVVEARKDWKASDELGLWIYQLEEYYRSR